MLFNKFTKYTAWNVRFCPVLQIFLLEKCYLNISLYECGNVNVVVNVHLKIDPLMVYLKCSCLYSSGQLIDFNGIDTVLLDWGTYECNYRLLSHSTRNCRAHKTVCAQTNGPKYIPAHWRRNRNSIVHSSMTMCCEVKQSPLFIWSSQGPIWTFEGSVLCSRVPWQCSEGVLAPPHQHTFQLWSWTTNLLLLSPVPYRLSCHHPHDFLKL